MRRIRWVVSALSFCASVAMAEAPTAHTVSLKKHDAGTFYVLGALDGYGEISFLVDTGSSYMVINEAMLAALVDAGRATPLRQISGRMADGSRRVIPTYRVKNLRLGDSCWVPEVEAAVISGNTRPILGMEVLERLAPFTFSANPAQLVLHRCQSGPGLQSVTAATTPSRQQVVAEPIKPVSGGEGVAQ